jgi:hypothetical protein
MNDARRRVERDARVAATADQLAQAVEGLLADPERADLDSLRAALAHYRKASEG